MVRIRMTQLEREPFDRDFRSSQETSIELGPRPVPRCPHLGDLPDPSRSAPGKERPGNVLGAGAPRLRELACHVSLSRGRHTWLLGARRGERRSFSPLSREGLPVASGGGVLGAAHRRRDVARLARRNAMKIRCDRTEMVEKLGQIAGIVPSNSPKPIFFDFLIRTKDGGLEIEATDMEVAGLVRIERVEVVEEGEIALPAGRLSSILREIPPTASTVAIETVTEMHGASVQAEGFQFKLFGHDPEEFPHIT